MISEKMFFNSLGLEQSNAIEKLGYDFLEENGYKVDNAIKSNYRRSRIRQKMRGNREQLEYRLSPSKDGNILFYYELINLDTNEIKRSKQIKFVMTNIEDLNKRYRKEQAKLKKKYGETEFKISGEVLKKVGE